MYSPLFENQDIESAFSCSPSKLWARTAPAGIREAYQAGHYDEGWELWAECAGQIAASAPDLSLFLPGSAPLSAFSQAMFEKSNLSGETLDPQAVVYWLQKTSDSEAVLANPLDLLVIAWNMPVLATLLPQAAWWQILSHLLEIANQADSINPTEHPVAWQALAGELPLALSLLLPEVDQCQALTKSALTTLEKGLIALLDGQGLPYADHLDRLLSLVAVWTRSLQLLEHAEEESYAKSSRTQYEWAIRQTFRFTRELSASRWSTMLEQAVRLGGDENDRSLASICLKGEKPDRRVALPEPAYESEWASAAMLRTDWSAKASSLKVAYPAEKVSIELFAAREWLIRGDWKFEVKLDGKTLDPIGPWEQVCWVSDKDVDYLELEIPLDRGYSIQRTLLLARDDKFLYLADAVLGETSGKLEYRGELPLANGTKFEGAKESRDGYLSTSSRRALVLPIALPEWRDLDGPGELTVKKKTNGLVLQQHINASRLVAPLFIDLKPKRINRRFTWRRLTVVEALETVSRDVAAGYRVHVGNEQWLIYRSMTKPVNRSLLGHNLSSEMLVGRFDETGEVETLVEVE